MKKGQYVDITGNRYGRLVAIERTGDIGSRSLWRCKCDCGNETIVSVSNLRNGHTRSCGCLVIDTTKEMRTTHGCKGKYHHDRLYNVWRSMKQRCYRKETRQYRWYGAIGVEVCDEWRNSYVKFKEWAYANGYDPNAKRGDCTLDRIDCAGNYEPDNCRWVDMMTQAHNKREIKGESDE